MSKTGPIIIVEDDHDDQHMFTSIIETLGYKNPLRLFENGQDALDYLMSTAEQPFLILCDVNMPKLNGLEFRKIINGNDYLKKKSIPFIFVSTADNTEVVSEAYLLTVQGFFLKRNSYGEMMDDIQLMYKYWYSCRHPNKS